MQVCSPSLTNKKGLYANLYPTTLREELEIHWLGRLRIRLERVIRKKWRETVRNKSYGCVFGAGVTFWGYIFYKYTYMKRNHAIWSALLMLQHSNFKIAVNIVDTLHLIHECGYTRTSICQQTSGAKIDKNIENYMMSRL